MKYNVKNQKNHTDVELLKMLEESDTDLEYNLPYDDEHDFEFDHSVSEESSDDDGEGIYNSFFVFWAFYTYQNFFYRYYKAAQSPVPGTASNDAAPTWSDDPEEMKNFPFSKRNELLQSIPGNGDPIDYFRAIFDNILDLIERETNNYAEQFFYLQVSSKNHALLNGNP